MRSPSAKFAPPEVSPLLREESSPGHKLRRTTAAARAASGKPSLLVTAWRRFGRQPGSRTGLVLLVIAVVLTASAHFLEREWAGWLGQRVPVSWVQAASARALERLDANALSPTALSIERQNTINTEFAALTIPQGETPLYSLVFRKGGPFGARSFTLSGGQIIVTDELVIQSRDERSLLAALTVQLGHLQNHDALRSSVDHASASILMALFRGDAQTGIKLMSDVQPVLEHEAHCEEEAREFSRIVMQANP